MDMLNANEAAEAARGKPKSAGEEAVTGKRKGKGKATGRATQSARKLMEESNPTAPASEASNTSDDEQGEDTRQDMEQEISASEEDSDGDEEEDEDERHARLLGFVGSLGEQQAAAERAAEDRRSSQLLTEGEFNPTTVARGGGGGGFAGVDGVSRTSGITMEVKEFEVQGGVLVCLSYIKVYIVGCESSTQRFMYS